MNIDGEFVNEYGRFIESRLLAQGVPREELQDWVGMVYERLLSHFSYDEERGPFTTWLSWVVRSVVSNERKKRERSGDVLDHAIDLDAANNTIGEEDAGTAEDELDRIFDLALERNLVSYKDVAILKGKYIKEYTSQELADRYDMPVQTIRNICHTSMKALRELAEG